MGLVHDGPDCFCASPSPSVYTIFTLTEKNRYKIATRLTLLHRAIQTHTSLTRQAATGRGIDRHLLGLRLMMRPENDERAALFDDPLFERSQDWKLSTSGLSAGTLFRGTGYVASLSKSVIKLGKS
jgi:Choline/Carnitine o-acyltransferase